MPGAKGTTTSRPASSGDAYEAVCTAAARAAEGDAAGAARSFEDAHGDLHDLAAAADRVDARAAAALLRAKQAVEASPSETALRALATEVGRAIAATGGAVPPPCS